MLPAIYILKNTVFPIRVYDPVLDNPTPSLTCVPVQVPSSYASNVDDETVPLPAAEEIPYQPGELCLYIPILISKGSRANYNWNKKLSILFFPKTPINNIIEQN